MIKNAYHKRSEAPRSQEAAYSHSDLRILIDDLFEETSNEDNPDLRQELIKKFIEGLLAESAKFAKVFRTQKGSYYFILETGESLRFRYNESEENNQLSKSGFQIQPACQHVVFTSQEVEMGRTDKHGNVLEIIIFKASYEIGSVPVEVGFADSNPVVLNEENGTTRCVSRPFPDYEQDYLPQIVYHRGHPISQIIK